MSDGDDGLIARIRQIRRGAAVTDRSNPRPDAPTLERVAVLEERVTHLEALVEGLQDSVHREFERHADLIAKLQNQVQPGAMGESLARDARERGL